MAIYLISAAILSITVHTIIFIWLYRALKRRYARLEVAVVNSTMTESEQTIRRQVLDDYERILKIGSEGVYRLEPKIALQEARKLNGLSM